MNIIRNEFEGLLVLEPKVFGDQRGFFMETWNQQRYRAAGITEDFVQDNVSFSRKDTLRGLHFQNPAAQGKLVMVLQGEIFDVVVDIRRQSPTFKRCFSLVLSAENKRQFYIPPGFAHGFAVLSETVLFHYKCTDYYSPKDEQAIRWNDPEFAIDWPVKTPILSQRDAQAPLLKDIPVERLY
ncbi:MAG: dTDP-4-dehydrorhamnose 3,5-epimerase [Verrucomicrobiota bacterium]